MDDPPPSDAKFTEADRESANRRSEARFRVELNVGIGSEHNFYQGFAENLSGGGVFIATHVQRHVGEKMDFSIQLPDSEEPITGTGEVRWIREYSESSDARPGVGLRFLELSDGAIERIERFLKEREPLFFDED
jgi:type IV pilus assembly protein PilZ